MFYFCIFLLDYYLLVVLTHYFYLFLYLYYLFVDQKIDIQFLRCLFSYILIDFGKRESVYIKL